LASEFLKAQKQDVFVAAYMDVFTASLKIQTPTMMNNASPRDKSKRATNKARTWQA
jgi:hypothetical protein